LWSVPKSCFTGALQRNDGFVDIVFPHAARMYRGEESQYLPTAFLCGRIIIWGTPLHAEGCRPTSQSFVLELLIPD